MFSAKASLVLLAVTLNLCRSEEVQVGDQRMNTRLLGSLNRYYVFSGATISNRTDYLNLQNTVASINELTFLDGTQTITFVIHGRVGAAFSVFGLPIKTAIINENRENVVILVDWALVSLLDYASASHATPFVADDLILLITQMEAQNKINRNLVHIVGFDLGAHIAGMVSRNSRSRVQRITALSPAGQSWDEFSRRLRATDANYVEVLHTDYSGSRAFGIGDQIGTVDLFANNGTSQPGCSTNQCNHERAWQLFVATLDLGGHLVGLRCETITDMTMNRCTSGPALALGGNQLFKTASGIYRVNTGGVYPYNV